ncbi:MAG TPA: polysaccharide lyase family protein, partial [Verrucomicrobiae bacterium]
NYGEAQTEAFRTGILNGPYTLMFDNGQPPVAPLDYSWLETAGLNLTNFVPATGRGTVAGTVNRVPAGFQAVVGFANATAQYWAVATNGSYATPLMIPGTYTATLYKQELAVATASVTVSAGGTNTLNLVSTEATPAFIFKLGEWDGTPNGFLNAANIQTMHPSDARNASWTNTDFTIESNPTPRFPSIQARAVNGTLTVRFNLTASQAVVGHTLRIGITTAYNGGRPKVTMNSWTSSNPAAPSEPDTRTFTVGTYRGNNSTPMPCIIRSHVSARRSASRSSRNRP